jgi:AcrR family transcriptional regulator
MPKGIPLTREEIDRRRHEIFRATMALIRKQGFHETSMQQIARAAGVGKSTLYDYFPSKSHVLIFVFEEELKNLQVQVEGLVAQDLRAREKLENTLAVHLEFLIRNKQFFTEMPFRASRLSRVGQQRIMKARHTYQDLLGGILEQGVQEGVFRRINTRLAARVLISMVEVLVYTTRPTGTPQDMLPEALGMFMDGIQRSGRGGSRSKK